MNIDELALKVANEYRSPQGHIQMTATQFIVEVRELLKQYEADQGEAVAHLVAAKYGMQLCPRDIDGAFPVYLRPDPKVKELEAERDQWKNDAINGGNAAYLREQVAELERQLAEAKARKKNEGE